MSASDSPEPQDPEPDVLEAVERAMAALETHRDPAVREAARALLGGIDAVHRAGLTHLMHAIHSMAGEAFVNRLMAVPAIRMLLMSYDLVAVDRRIQAEEALDLVRPHLHGHGIDIEIVEVVGGVVYVRVHQSQRDGAGDRPSLDAIRRDIESALRDAFVGFQELVINERPERTGPPAFVPLGAVLRANRPVYVDVIAADELPVGTARAAWANDLPVLLANVSGDVYAVRNQCGDSPLPLDTGTLAGAEIRCPWHGCRYDVRSGQRLDADEARLRVFPTSVEAGRIRIAIDVSPAEVASPPSASSASSAAEVGRT